MKPKRQSAGILLYRFTPEELQFFLVHPGGPFWEGREWGTWTIPKGEGEAGEAPLQTALREFREETGTALSGPFHQLTPVLQKAGKEVSAWAMEGDIDPDTLTCNTIRIEWPYKSGKWNTYPEVDKGGWFGSAEAKKRINPAQVAFLDELAEWLEKKGND